MISKRCVLGSGEYSMLCPHADRQNYPVHRFRSSEGQ